jgi:ubiquinone/menaquinone biosynthesis C-methylase UbiE
MKLLGLIFAATLSSSEAFGTYSQRKMMMHKSTSLTSTLSETAEYERMEEIETMDADNENNVDSNTSITNQGTETKTVGVQSMNVNDSFSSPAEYENSIFLCDKNVQMWADFNKDGEYEEIDYLNEISAVTNRFTRKGGDALEYFARHSARTGYFITNGVLGTLSSKLHERLRSTNEPADSFANSMMNAKVVSAIVAEVVLTQEQDYERIAEGKYRRPYDMYSRNRQNSPLYFGQQTAKFVNEAIGTLARRNRGTEEDKRTWLTDNTSTELYPDYYKTAFHYQTDGWMSQESANVYETSTETLFLGRQDAMQRTALVPLVEFANEQKDVIGRPLKILEVACGTGRFMTFARDNLPLDADFTGVDLSPFYLDKARDNDKNWRGIRKRMENSNSEKKAENQIKPATFVQAKAEALPFDDEEFDAVICMYLYHELPREVRAQAAREMARVTKKGGRVILTDSLQKGDRPVVDKVLGNFEKMNEPHYCDYIEDFLPDHFIQGGLEPLTKSFCSRSKTLEFGMPAV